MNSVTLNRRLVIAWISFFPIEWLEDISPELRSLPKMHPASWQRVLLGELEKRADIQLHIVVLRKHFARSQTFERNGVVFHLIKTIGGLRAPSFYWLDTLLIRRELARIEPDVVHAWGTEGGAALVAGRLGYPYLVTSQGLLNWIGESVPLNRYDRFHAYLEDLAFRGARTVTAESSFAIRYLRRRYPDLDLHQVEHAPLEVFSQVERRPRRSPFQFLFVGGFNFLKGSDVLVRSLDSLATEVDFELVCVGGVDESFRESLKTEVSSSVWRRIRFLGSKTASEIAGLLAEATLMIYPTRCDNSPNAVKEAAVAGVPVLASKVGGIVDYIWPDENGLLFEPEISEGAPRRFALRVNTHFFLRKGYSTFAGAGSPLPFQRNHG
ncbi:MAG: glycosyltransferase family 4 protein [Verrucomicrobia bacterium]|nr:glycosyltransferase family 4 protein [Verrucomicrobiota bacterium]